MSRAVFFPQLFSSFYVSICLVSHWLCHSLPLSFLTIFILHGFVFLQRILLLSSFFMSLTIFCTPPAYPSFVFFLSPIIFLRSSSSVVFFVTLILPPSSFSLPFLSLSGSVLYHLIFIFYNLLYQAFVFSQLANFPAQFFISPTGLNLFQSLFLLCLIFVSNHLQVASLIHLNFYLI